MKADMNGLNEAVVKKLIKRGLKISAAESCTGGLFSALVTDIAGASEVLDESIVTYSNAAKMRELGVKEETLDTVGAVSYETAYQMAEGIRVHTGADVGVGITGIAGPGGGTDDKPVGTVFAGISVYDKTTVMEMHFDGDRGSVREQTCLAVFKKIDEFIK